MKNSHMYFRGVKLPNVHIARRSAKDDGAKGEEKNERHS